MTSQPSTPPDDDEAVSTHREAVLSGKPLREPDGTLVYPTVSSRPKPDFTLDLPHKALLAASVAVPLVFTGFVAIHLAGVEGEVPVHFGFDGSANRYGSPWELMIALIISLVCLLGCAVLTRYPRIYNMPFELTSENVQRQYKNSVQMMIWLCAGLGLLTIAMGMTALDPSGGLPWLFWLGLALTVLGPGLGIARMYALR